MCMAHNHLCKIRGNIFVFACIYSLFFQEVNWVAGIQGWERDSCSFHILNCMNICRSQENKKLKRKRGERGAIWREEREGRGGQTEWEGEREKGETEIDWFPWKAVGILQRQTLWPIITLSEKNDNSGICILQHQNSTTIVWPTALGLPSSLTFCPWVLEENQDEVPLSSGLSVQVE